MSRSDSTIAKVAELVVLERFDVLRSVAGHDYGAGQRTRELRRRSNELDLRHLLNVSPEKIEPNPAELLAAFERVSGPRLRRIEAEDYRRSTPSTQRTLRTWRRLSAELRGGLEAERRAAGVCVGCGGARIRTFVYEHAADCPFANLEAVAAGGEYDDSEPAE